MENNTNSRLSFIQKFKSQPIFRQKFLYTIWICLAFIMLGWSEAMFGPTFPDLRLIIGEPLDTASWLFTATSAGFLIGSGITGVLYDKYNRLIVLTCSIVGVAIATAAIPWCKYFWLMVVVKILAGMLAASLDTGGNAEIVSTWDIEANSYMQALHFCFSLGGMISPLVAQPFLLETSDLDINMTKQTNDAYAAIFFNASNDLNQSNRSRNMNTLFVHDDRNMTFGSFSNNISYMYFSNDEEAGQYLATNETKVWYPYLITAILVLLSAIPFAFMYFTQQTENAKVSRLTESRQPTNFYKRPLPIRLLILGTLSFLMFIYVGTDDVYAGLLMTFVISHLKWTKSKGSIATAIHWTSFGVARLGCIFLVRIVKTSKLMVIFGVCLVLSYIGLLLATIYNEQTLLWILICFPGLSMSLLFPAMFTWTNENVVCVSGRISSMFLMSSSLGVMLFPPLYGHTMESFTTMWFLYLLLGQSILWVSLFVATTFLSKYLLTKRVESIEPENEPLNVELKDMTQNG